jgi:hypothetical protein
MRRDTVLRLCEKRVARSALREALRETLREASCEKLRVSLIARISHKVQLTRFMSGSSEL